MMLADLGAEVIKIEKQGTGDDSRDFAPVVDGISGYFLYLNRNKKGIALDLKTPEAIQVIKDMVIKADIVLENYSPGVMDRLGIGYEEIRRLRPDIIYGSISGFGQTGPYKHKVAYDTIAQAMGGYMNLSGFPDKPPTKLAPSIADANAGIHMAFALASALYYREKTGIGQYIDISMMDTVFSTLENFVMMKSFGDISPQRNGNSNPNAAPFNTFRTKDGTHIAIAIANATLFEKFSVAIGCPELASDPKFIDNVHRKRNELELHHIVETWTLKHSAQEICDILDAARVPVGPILSVDQLLDDPQNAEREMMIEIDHPIAGIIQCPGNPIKFSETKIDHFEPSPLLGQHGEEILRKIANYSEEQIHSLKEKHII